MASWYFSFLVVIGVWILGVVALGIWIFAKLLPDLRKLIAFNNPADEDK